MTRKDLLKEKGMSELTEKQRAKLQLTPYEIYLSKIQRYAKYIPDLLVVDECSMVHLLLMKDLLKFCKVFDCRLILLGDENQLPPIGPGDVLRQIIESTMFREHNVTYLTEIMRQTCPNLKAGIQKVIENDEYLTSDDFKTNNMVFEKYDSFLNEKKEMSNDKLKDFLKRYGLDKDMTTVQFLTPQETKTCGHDNVNVILQDIFNPYSGINKIDGTTFRKGDRVVRIVNDYVKENKKTSTRNNVRNDNGINEYIDDDDDYDDDGYLYANGDTGVITDNVKTRIDPLSGETISHVTIRYDDEQHKDFYKEQEVSIRELNEQFKLRYCLSIHKSQGNQYENVVLLIGTPHSYMWTNKLRTPKKLLYTAISRTKERCYVIGNEQYLLQSQMQDDVRRPSTFLSSPHV